MKVVVTGKFKPGVSAKDFIHKFIGDVRADGADYMSVEFHGEGIENMSIAERMTLCNMGIEFGAKNAVCKPDQKELDAIKGKRSATAGECIWADEDAVYAKEFHYDLGDIEPGVAKPHKSTTMLLSKRSRARRYTRRSSAPARTDASKTCASPPNPQGQ